MAQRGADGALAPSSLAVARPQARCGRARAARSARRRTPRTLRRRRPRARGGASASSTSPMHASAQWSHHLSSSVPGASVAGPRRAARRRPGAPARASCFGIEAPTCRPPRWPRAPTRGGSPRGRGSSRPARAGRLGRATEWYSRHHSSTVLNVCTARSSSPAHPPFSFASASAAAARAEPRLRAARAALLHVPQRPAALELVLRARRGRRRRPRRAQVRARARRAAVAPRAERRTEPARRTEATFSHPRAKPAC